MTGRAAEKSPEQRQTASPLKITRYSDSPLSSAAIRPTCSKTREGGGFSAMKVRFR